MTPKLEMQRVEFFHLNVLRLLCAGPDKAHVALKGGCNMRFFFGSIRYSQDMDLDVSFDDFQGQVVAYLRPDHAPMYADRSSWNALQTRVVEALQEASP